MECPQHRCASSSNSPVYICIGVMQVKAAAQVLPGVVYEGLMGKPSHVSAMVTATASMLAAAIQPWISSITPVHATRKRGMLQATHLANICALSTCEVLSDPILSPLFSLILHRQVLEVRISMAVPNLHSAMRIAKNWHPAACGSRCEIQAIRTPLPVVA